MTDEEKKEKLNAELVSKIKAETYMGDKQNVIITTDYENWACEFLDIGDEIAIDTETTGLEWWGDAKPFSVIISDACKNYYFNMQPYIGIPDKYVLDCGMVSKMVEHCISRSKWIFAHNAKFDMHQLNKLGVDVFKDGFSGWIDTATGARVLKNNHRSYSLDACSKRMGYRKDDLVKFAIDSLKLYTMKTVPGKATKVKVPHFDKVPWNVIVPYGLMDGEVTYKLGRNLLKTLGDAEDDRKEIFELENDITPVVYRMEDTGVLVDENYCIHAIDSLSEDIENLEKKWTELTGEEEFINSGKKLATIFNKKGEDLYFSDKGNPKFDLDTLLKNYKDSPLVSIITGIRNKKKMIGTYFQSYLHCADKEGYIHASIAQAGTRSGRFSCYQPNLQNVPKEDNKEWPVRRAFVAPEGMDLLAVDYNQMEFRMAMEYAREMSVIEEINAGKDPHTSTAELVGIPRRAAKVLNFAVLYGMGAKGIAELLECPLNQAYDFRRKYYDRMPRLREFIESAKRAGQERGYLRTKFGRRSYLDSPKEAYRAANYIIQGSCADILKRAMNHIDTYLAARKSKMVLTIHDELWFYVDRDEFDTIYPTIKTIMTRAGDTKLIPLTVSGSRSTKSFADLEDIE